jgi:hypothetical protein
MPTEVRQLVQSDVELCAVRVRARACHAHVADARVLDAKSFILRPHSKDYTNTTGHANVAHETAYHDGHRQLKGVLRQHTH